MRKRTAFTDERIQTVKSIAMDVANACDDIINGDTVLTAATNRGMDMLKFRRIIYAMESAKGVAPDGARNKAITNDCLLTPVERMYMVIFDCGPDDVYSIMPLDPEDSIRHASSYLSEKEQLVLRRRYCVDVANEQINEKYAYDDDVRESLEEIGKDLGVTRERISKLEHRAIRKLRHKSRLDILRRGVYATDEIKRRAEEIRDSMIEDEAKKLAEELARREVLERAKVSGEATRIIDIDLSFRSIKCLTLVGVATVGDLLDMDELTFSNIRNLGAKSRGEIIDWLEQNGYGESALVTLYRQRH